MKRCPHLKITVADACYQNEHQGSKVLKCYVNTTTCSKYFNVAGQVSRRDVHVRHVWLDVDRSKSVLAPFSGRAFEVNLSMSSAEIL